MDNAAAGYSSGPATQDGANISAFVSRVGIAIRGFTFCLFTNLASKARTAILSSPSVAPKFEYHRRNQAHSLIHHTFIDVHGVCTLLI